MQITLSPDLEKLIDAEVRAGHFASPEEFLSVAAKHFVIARNFGETYTTEAIDAKIQRGIAQIERGETVDGDEVFARLRAKTAELRRQRA